MLATTMFSLFAIFVIGWVLHINANDRKILEKELQEELVDTSDDPF